MSQSSEGRIAQAIVRLEEAERALRAGALSEKGRALANAVAQCRDAGLALFEDVCRREDAL